MQFGQQMAEREAYGHSNSKFKAPYVVHSLQNWVVSNESSCIQSILVRIVSNFQWKSENEWSLFSKTFGLSLLMKIGSLTSFRPLNGLRGRRPPNEQSSFFHYITPRVVKSYFFKPFVLPEDDLCPLRPSNYRP